MLDFNTADKLREMKLGVMANAFREQLGDKAFLDLSFEERVGLISGCGVGFKGKQQIG